MASLQNQLSLFWKKQNTAQRVTIIALLVASAVIVPILISWAATPSYSVAYSGLSEGDAGQIVQKLDESSITYKLKGSGTILVPSDKVYEVRLKMAKDGLPKASTVGYELFSGNTLGMTEFTQRVNYQRALEGELERTISSLEGVDGVRVHIVTPEKTLLSSEQSPTTASVTIQEKPDYRMETSQVRAITHLVASSIEGLKPENVVLVDSNGNMLAGGANDDASAAAAQSDNQRAAEIAAAAEIRKKVQYMLDQILGPNRSTVQASVSMDWNQKEITSSIFEPTPAAIRSSQKISESYNANGVTTGGVPGADSNLPTPVPTVAGAEDQNYYQRNEEIINYEISQTQSHEYIAPGRVNRVSVSVMVDNVTDQAQLNIIRSAVAAAAGIDESRGDQIVVESIAFDRSYYETQDAEFKQTQKTNQYIQYGVAGAAILFLIIVFSFFSRKMRNLRTASIEAWRPVMKPVSEVAAFQPQVGGTIPRMPASIPVKPEAVQQPVVRPEINLGAELSVRQVTNPEDEQRSKIIARLSEESPATVAEIIQIWLNEDNKNHG